MKRDDPRMIAHREKMETKRLQRAAADRKRESDKEVSAQALQRHIERRKEAEAESADKQVKEKRRMSPASRAAILAMGLAMIGPGLSVRK